MRGLFEIYQSPVIALFVKGLIGFCDVKQFSYKHTAYQFLCVKIRKAVIAQSFVGNGDRLWIFIFDVRLYSL
jgi:hypothetical protein